MKEYQVNLQLAERAAKKICNSDNGVSIWIFNQQYFVDRMVKLYNFTRDILIKKYPDHRNFLIDFVHGLCWDTVNNEDNQNRIILGTCTDRESSKRLFISLDERWDYMSKLIECDEFYEYK